MGDCSTLVSHDMIPVELGMFYASFSGYDSLCRTGTRGGLSLVLNVETYYYMRAMFSSAGIHVLISEPTESKVVLENRGHSVSVGTHTTIQLQQTKVGLF